MGERRGRRRWCDGDRGGRGVLIIARGQQRDRALVIRGGTRPVNLLMEPRNRGKNEREEDRADAPRGHNGVQCSRLVLAETHAHSGASVVLPAALRKSDLLEGDRLERLPPKADGQPSMRIAS
jgi:hypothetical protein